MDSTGHRLSWPPMAVAANLDNLAQTFVPIYALRLAQLFCLAQPFNKPTIQSKFNLAKLINLSQE